MDYPWPSQIGDINYISPAPSKEWVMSKRKIVVLGSTGSIGNSALSIMKLYPGRFEVKALAAARNVALLAEQAEIFKPPYLAVYDEASRDVLRKLLPKGYKPEILYGPDGYVSLASLEEANTVLSAQVGAAGLKGTISAALSGKVICLANKESLVLAGDLIRAICKQTKASILPVDSEHNAIFQIIGQQHEKYLKRVILTASGGPFFGYTSKELQSVTSKEALKHPNWSMGAKITIDSASLMNKGLELIEAMHLYGLEASKLDVVVHPQSIIHSLVEFADNSFLAHLGSADMRMPLGNCMLWPDILDVGVKELDFIGLGNLTFAKPDIHSFPCLSLAMRAMRERGGQCIVLNAANEAAVSLFLEGRISFVDIATLVEVTMNSHTAQLGESFSLMHFPEYGDIHAQAKTSLKAILDLDAKARSKVFSLARVQE